MYSRSPRSALTGHSTCRVEHKLPVADSIVYATAQRVGSVVWTQNNNVECLADVEYFLKSGGAS